MDKEKLKAQSDAVADKGKEFKAKAIEFVTNKFWIAIGVVVIVVAVLLYF